MRIPVKFSHEWEVKTIKEIKIPKEIRQYKESIFFGLSARQFFCAIFAVGIAAGAYLLLGDVIGKETASWLCIVLAAPAAMAGFFTYNGMTFEQFLWAVIVNHRLNPAEFERRILLPYNIRLQGIRKHG